MSCSLVSEQRLGMLFDQAVVCRNCLENIHEKYLSVSTSYPEKSVRLNYFVAASEYLSQLDFFDHDIALKLRPYGCLTGINHSAFDKYLRIPKKLNLHAILHDAGGFLYGIYKRGSFFHMLPWKSSNCFSGHLSGILFCVYIVIFHPSIFHL